MKRFAIIPPNKLPIPDVMGGAIEGLTTYLIEENSYMHRCEFEVFNQEKCANEIDAIAIDGCRIHHDIPTILDRLYDIFWLIARKLLNYSIPFRSAYLSRVIRQIKKRNFDGVLIEGNPNYVWEIAEKTGLDVFLHIHTDHVLDEQTHSYKQIIAHSQKIICVSEYIRKQLSYVTEMDDSKLHVCLNCTDQQQFNNEKRLQYRDEMRRKLGYTDDDVVYIFAGRVVPMKGVGELIEAFKQCNVKGKKLLIVGGSAFSGAPETEFTRYLQQETRQSEGLIQMTGYIDKRELPRYYAAADIYVSPSKYDEAAPLANIEAMSMGLLCIVSNKGGTLEYTNDSCLVVDVENSAVKNIKQVLEQAAEKLKTYSANPTDRENAINSWSINRYYEDMMQLILSGQQN